MGPNGKGKSTLLKLIAKRQVPVPGSIDVLLVEQEVVGDDRTALEAVVAADVELMQLREEEKELTEALNDMSLSEHDQGEKSDRLTEASGMPSADAAAAAEPLRRPRLRRSTIGCRRSAPRPPRPERGRSSTASASARP